MRAPTDLAEARRFIEATIEETRTEDATPEAPVPSLCCGRGCGHCVFVQYYAQLAAWRRQALARAGLPEAITRPAIANERPKEDGTGTVVLQLKSP